MMTLWLLWMTLVFQDQAAPPLLRAGEMVEGTIESTDPIVTTETLAKKFTDAPVRGKTYRIEVEVSGPYYIELRSHFFNAYLVLRDEAQHVLAEDDDGLLGRHAWIVVETLESKQPYTLQVCALHGEQGPFTLRLMSGKPLLLSEEEKRAALLEDARARVQAVEARYGEKSREVIYPLKDLAEVL